MYKIVYTKAAAKDISKLKGAHLDKKAKALIELIKKDPYQKPPSYCLLYTSKKRGGQKFSQNIDYCRFPYGQQQDDREKDRGRDQGTDIAKKGYHKHFISGRSGSGNRDKRSDT